MVVRIRLKLLVLAYYIRSDQCRKKRELASSHFYVAHPWPLMKWTGDLDTGMLASRLRCSEPTLLAAEMSPVYLGVVSPLGNIFEDLKSLPPERLEAAADFIRRLKPVSQLERQAALDRTFGCLSPEEADELERVIEEGCGKIDEDGW